MSTNSRFVNVIVDSGFKYPLTYIDENKDLTPGDIVVAPYRNSHKLGVILEEVEAPKNVVLEKFKSINAQKSIPLPKDLFETLKLLKIYYLADAREIMRTMRLSIDILRQRNIVYKTILDAPQLTPLQRKIYDAASEGASLWQLLEISPKAKAAIEQLVLARVIEEGVKNVTTSKSEPASEKTNIANSIKLSDAQIKARDALVLYQSKPLLFWGDTGSGKTVVVSDFYVNYVENGRQWLILLPEIALLANIAERIKTLTRKRVAIYHGGLSLAKRTKIVKDIVLGEVDIIIGTRSTVFLPFNNLGLIMVDECHDRSYKDAQSCRYHARDIAVTRAKYLRIPIILSSATPDLESMYNCDTDKYQLVRLKERFGKGQLAKVDIVDLTKEAHVQGLSSSLLKRIEQTLHHNEQALIFINRKGFAPVLLCGDCNWKAECPNCSTRLTWFKKSANLKCHSCGFSTKVKENCPNCHGHNLIPIGLATQRVESLLVEQFPHARVLRVDREVIESQQEIEQAINKIEQHHVDIIVSTQILAKAVNFEKLTFVAVLDVDQGLLSLDPRAAEYTGQQVIQVLGRAGRFKGGAKALIQTGQANRVEIDLLRQHDWQGYAKYLLSERYMAQLPPYAASLVIRGDSQNKFEIESAFEDLYQLLTTTIADNNWEEEINVTPSFSARIERVDRYYRRIIFITAKHRKTRNALINKVASRLDKVLPAKTCRWHIDVDPIELG